MGRFRGNKGIKIKIDKSKLKKFKISDGPHLKKLKEGKDITYEGKKYKFKDLTFKFNPISLASEKSILSNAEILANIGIKVADKKSHPVLAYLRNKGFSIPLDAEFEGIQKSANPFQKKDKKTDKMTSDLDRQGVSEEGMRKLEAQQMM